jgi:hypothetical protein
MRQQLPTLRHLAAITALAALPLFAPAASTIAQQATPVAAGDRVRVIAATGRQARHKGTVVAVRGDTLQLDRGGSDPLAIPFGSVARLDRSLGDGRCSGLGARTACMLLAGLSGTLVGGAIGFYTTQDGSDLAGMGALFGAPVGFIVGLVVGGFVGGERWQRIR